MKKAKGFTIIELFIVLVIIGILITASWPAIDRHWIRSHASDGMIVDDQPAKAADPKIKCENGIVTRDGVAVKRANGDVMAC